MSGNKQTLNGIHGSHNWEKRRLKDDTVLSGLLRQFFGIFSADTQISYKVNCSITDNSSNFLNVFRNFESATTQNKDNLSRRSDANGYEEDEFNDEEDDKENVVSIVIDDILNHGQYQLQMEGEEHEKNISREK